MTEPLGAPELDAGLGWLNTDRPLLLSGELRGQIVLLDFWTYCCINCIHILPDLAHLEEKYKDQPVTVIGVHSAKFTNEASPETIRAAILRYEIRHPVVNDDDMKLWRAYGVRSWPTQVVIDATGRIYAVAAGEGKRGTIDQAIAHALEEGRRAGSLASGPLSIRREASVRAASGLAFPGKVLAIEETNRLFVADSNHNRIIVAELPDERGRASVISTVGTGEIGRDNGPADKATFNHPQGLAVGHGNLYVADTENHMIRSVDLRSFEVTTIVGTGEMSQDRAGGLMGTQQGLNSPWDLAIEGSTLYVAMAGAHQIWRIDLPVGFARALAGTGRENIVDGATETAALSQPSGICLLGGKIYFADSEVSAIRGIDMAKELVFTIIGEGLFSFGDVDGVFPEAKLQHPLGIDAWKIALLVADTYNHKIKLVDPQARAVRTLYGTGRPGTSAPDGGAAFFEPGGLSVISNQVFVADTNNHRIMRIDLATHAWQEVVFEGLDAPERGDGSTTTGAIHASPFHLADGEEVELAISVELPAGAHLSPEAPWSVRVSEGGRTLAQHTGQSDSMPLRCRIPAHGDVGGQTWHVAASFAYCLDGGAGLCMPASLAWAVPVESGGPGRMIELSGRLAWDETARPQHPL